MTKLFLRHIVGARLRVLRKKRFDSQRKQKQKRMIALKNMKVRFRVLKAEMGTIRREQISIKEGQSEVREKLKAIETECEELKQEMTLVMRQSVSTHLRLGLMLNILKAREHGDLAKAAHLTQQLRVIIAARDKGPANAVFNLCNNRSI